MANTPGLAGSLLVGLVAAKALCVALRHPADRRQPPPGPHLRLPLGRRRGGLSLRGADRQRRAHAASTAAAGRWISSSSGRPSTTPPARPSTRWPACSGCRIPAGRPSRTAAEGGNPRAYRFPARVSPGRRPARFQLQRPEDGGALSRLAPERPPHRRGDRARRQETRRCGADSGRRSLSWSPCLLVSLSLFLPFFRRRPGRQLPGGGGRLPGRQGVAGAAERPAIRTLCVGGGVAANGRPAAGLSVGQRVGLQAAHSAAGRVPITPSWGRSRWSVSGPASSQISRWTYRLARNGRPAASSEPDVGGTAVQWWSHPAGVGRPG